MLRMFVLGMTLNSLKHELTFLLLITLSCVCCGGPVVARWIRSQTVPGSNSVLSHCVIPVSREFTFVPGLLVLAIPPQRVVSGEK